MKKVVLAVLVLATVGFSANAQHKPMKRQGQHRQMAKLNLTEAQRTQAKAINEQFKTRMQELNKKESITVKEYRAQKETLRKEQRASMQALFTPEQKAQIEQMKAEGKARKEAGYAKRMDKMKQRLQLSEDQMAKMKASREGLRSKLQAIKSNESLSRDQRKEQVMALRKEYKNSFDNILTAEQKEKLKAVRNKRPARMEAK